MPLCSVRYVLSCFIRRTYSATRRECKVLGIETSCDDTGCAIVDQSGSVLGECLNSQQDLHSDFGGILPPLARDLHSENIDHVVNKALDLAKLSVQDVDAIGVTNRPGMPLSLLVGLNFAKQLAMKYHKPLIPIHHMEAHALTVRMIGKVEFPFLVLLVSGGHCLLAVAKNVDSFITLGSTFDDAPGEAFDKVWRRLKLANLPEMGGLSGGKGLEAAASRGDPFKFPIAEPLLRHRDCNFSFAGIKNSCRTIIIEEEKKHGIEGDGVVPSAFDVCAGAQFAITKHLCRRVQRAMAFVSSRGLLPPDNLSLVVSGGVACNQFVKAALGRVCDHHGYRLSVPPPRLCTDNGVMIAWNAVERYLAGSGLHQHHQLNPIDIYPKCPLGVDISEEVANEDIKCKWIPERILFPRP